MRTGAHARSAPARLAQADVRRHECAARSQTRGRARRADCDRRQWAPCASENRRHAKSDARPRASSVHHVTIASCQWLVWLSLHVLALSSAEAVHSRYLLRLARALNRRRTRASAPLPAAVRLARDRLRSHAGSSHLCAPAPSSDLHLHPTCATWLSLSTASAAMSAPQSPSEGSFLTRLAGLRLLLFVRRGPSLHALMSAERLAVDPA